MIGRSIVNALGLVPKDSEQFRGDIMLRQCHRRQRMMSDKQMQQQQQHQQAYLAQQQQQAQQQYDAIMQLQQQQNSPAPYGINTPSLPNTPNKLVRPPTAVRWLLVCVCIT